MNGLAGGAKSLLRIVAALLFLQHGGQKLLGWFGGFPGGHLDPLLRVAGCIELIGGALLLVGLVTRPVAFLASGEMAVAYFKVHIERSFFPINNRGDNVVLFCFVMLYMAFAGGGVWGLDHWLAMHRRAGDSTSRASSPSPSRPRSSSPSPATE